MNVNNKDVEHDKSIKTNLQKNLLSHYKSSELFQGNDELIIVHEQEQYRLRITRHGKLILTK